jgi:hypothetical protein
MNNKKKRARKEGVYITSSPSLSFQERTQNESKKK